jgi:ribonuclease P protein component
MPASAVEMLRSRSDFVALQQDARSRVDRILVVRYRRNELEHHRFGISTGKRLGNAVIRNRTRRRIREALRRLDQRPGPGFDFLVVARPASADATYQQITDSLRRTIGQIGAGEGTRQA